MASGVRRARLAKKDTDSSSRQREAKSKSTSRNAFSKLQPSCEIIEISSDEEDDTANFNQSTLVVDLHKRIAQLKDENSNLQHDLEQGRTSLKGKVLLDAGEIEDNTNCGVCALRMWSPCLLPDCGHTFCQSCLQDWFSTTLFKFMADHPEYDQNQLDLMTQLQASLVDQLNTPGPQYSCPACRKTVHTKPVEVYALKALVRIVASATGEKSPRKDSSFRNGKKGNSTFTGVWDRFFPTQKSMN
ncbi:hypothetical protein AX15_007701 [Amanita polypyramis BW_CC]|nr:hypothetical protein AX15_007701 [Amanita polypyramis BW_CC]